MRIDSWFKLTFSSSFNRCFESDLLMIGSCPVVAGHPTVFTEVAKYKDWIAQQYGLAIP